jgi:hypothetical protein
MGDVTLKQVTFRGWQHCMRLSNGTVDVVVTTDIGPRVARYGFVDGENVFCEVHNEDGLMGGETWYTFGGHRLWHSPEASPRTYQPDNEPVAFEAVADGIILTPRPESATGIQKQIEVHLDADGTKVRLTHRLTNLGAWPVTLAVWAITVMAPGGIEVIPQARVDTGLLPNRCVALWPYARMDDPRVTWGDRFIVLRQDPATKAPFKLGVTSEACWSGYFNDHCLFVKRFPAEQGARYPDYGANYESYTTDFMLEMETLSPLRTLRPGETVEHMEVWELHAGVAFPGVGEEDISRALQSVHVLA